MDIKQVKYFLDRKVMLVWNDPDPIEGANYRITQIPELEELIKISDEEGGLEDMSITIQYGESEAQVYLHEIGLGYNTLMENGEIQDLRESEIELLFGYGLIYPCDDCNAFRIFPERSWGEVDRVLLSDKIDRMKLVIGSESVDIYIDNGDEEEPTHIVYWHLDEVEEDSSVAISIAQAIHLYHTDKGELIKVMNSVGAK